MSQAALALQNSSAWKKIYRGLVSLKARIHALSEIQKFWQNFWTFRKTCKSQFWLIFHGNQKTRTLMDTWRLPKSLGKRNSMNTFDLEFKVWWWETQNKIVIFQTFHLSHNHDRSAFWSWKAYSRTKHRLVDLDSNRQLRTIISPLCKVGQSEPCKFLVGAKKYSKSSFLAL